MNLFLILAHTLVIIITLRKYVIYFIFQHVYMSNKISKMQLEPCHFPNDLFSD